MPDSGERQEKGGHGHAGPPGGQGGPAWPPAPGPGPGRRAAVHWRLELARTRTEPLAFPLPAQPGDRSNTSTAAGHPGPRGGLGLRPGPWPGRARGLLPSRSSRSPRSWIPSSISRGWCALRRWSRGGGRATTEPTGLGPSVPVLPGAHLPGTMPPFGAAVLDPWEGTDPVSSPTRWFCRLGRERAVERGREPGPEQHDDTATTVCAGWRAALPAPGRQPAPPQHQGSREALPRHRLSLRCQALWMRLRASSNFLLEAS